MIKSALVTGGSGTLGQAVIQLLHSYNFKVISVGRNKPFAVPTGCLHLVCDFLNETDLSRICTEIKQLDPIDCAVFCAGIDSRIGGIDFNPQVFQRAMQVNCIAHLLLLRALREQVRRVKPLRLVVPSSNVLDKTDPNSLVYATSKIALEEGIRCFVAEDANTMSALILRLPFLGVLMAELAESNVLIRQQAVLVGYETPQLKEAIVRIEDFLVRDVSEIDTFKIISL